LFNRRSGSENHAVAPNWGPPTCLTCEGLERQHESNFMMVGFVFGILPAALLVMTGMCERFSIRSHVHCFLVATFAADVLVCILLFIGMIVGLTTAGALHTSCDPNSLGDEAWATAAKMFDADGPEGTAAVKAFILALVEPVADKTCHLAPRYTAVAIAQALAFVLCALSLLATTCVCCGMTEDGRDEAKAEDREVMELRGLMD